MLRLLKKGFMTEKMLTPIRNTFNRLVALQQDAPAQLSKLYCEVLLEVKQKINQTHNKKLTMQQMSNIEQFADYYMMTEQLVQYDLMSHLTMVRVINILFDNKSKRYNPTNIFYFNYYTLVNRLMKNVHLVDAHSYSTVLFAAARFKFSDFFQYTVDIVKRSEKDLLLNNQIIQKSLIYSLAKFGLVSDIIQKQCYQILSKPETLEIKLLINLIMYLALVRSIDADYLRANPKLEEILIKHLHNKSNSFYMERMANVIARLHYYDSPFLHKFLTEFQGDRFGANISLYGSTTHFGADHPFTRNLEKIIGFDIKTMGTYDMRNFHDQKFEMYEKSWRSKRHQKILKLLHNAIPLQNIQQEKSLDIFIVDIFIPRMNTVLEVDGPSHFIRKVSLIEGKDLIYPNLNTHFKHECLKKKGYNVMSLKNFMPTCEYLDQLQQLIVNFKD